MIYSGPDRVQTVTGIASNLVRRVEVVVNGVPAEASLRNNAFHWQASDASVGRDDITAILAHQPNGDVVTVNVDFD